MLIEKSSDNPILRLRHLYDVPAESVLLVLKSPLSLLALTFGAISLFELLHRHLELSTAPVIDSLGVLYRTCVSRILNGPGWWRRDLLPPTLQDLLVLYLASGRAPARAYALIYKETASSALSYEPFARPPFARLVRFSRTVAQRFGAAAGLLASAASTLIVNLLWPVYVTVLVRHPVATTVVTAPVASIGTPHPSGKGAFELPPLDDKARPKFAGDYEEKAPRINAQKVILAGAVVSLCAVLALLIGNSALMAIS